MTDSKCVFGPTLISGRNACQFAIQVVRRGGLEIDCHGDSAADRCKKIFDNFKAVALPEFGYEDNLLSLPHGIMLKIQYGGLLGLQDSLQNSVESDSINDIAGLIDQALNNYNDLHLIPYAQFVPRMQQYKVRRRR